MQTLNKNLTCGFKLEIFFSIGFTPCKAKQPLRVTELQEIKHEKKIAEYSKSI